MKWKLFAFVGLAMLLGFMPTSGLAADTASIYDTLATMKDHTVLWVAVTEAREATTLRGNGPYTLFAPTDAAFKKLDDATIKKIATDKATVKKLVRAHLVMGKYPVSDLKQQSVRTLQDTTLKGAEDGLQVGKAKLVVTDIRCSNGVIHVIDEVLPIANE